MGSEVVVDLSPLVDSLPCVIEREEDVLIQALFTELTVERLYECILLWLARLDEVDGHLVVCPGLKGS